MELLDRYLQAIKWWLPKAQRQDIIAELSEDIRSQIEDQEAELGRPLTEIEVEAVLQRRGSPLLVAGRYLPQRSLIGPVFFPFYGFVLKLVLLVYLLPWLLVWTALVLFDPSYHLAHPGFALLGTLEAFWLQALHLFVLITVLFAVAERSQEKSRSLERWSPHRLPVVRETSRIPRTQSLGELAGGGVFILWWLGLLPSPILAPLRITAAPIWASLFWPILLTALLGTSIAGVNLVRPYWTRLRTVVRLAGEVFSLVLLLLLFTAGKWVEIELPNGSPAAVEAAAKWANLAVLITLVVVALLIVLEVFREVRRILRRQALTTGMISGVA